MSRPQEQLLAATPLVFAGQQALKGLLRLQWPDALEGAKAHALATLFLMLVQVFWPTFAPVVAAGSVLIWPISSAGHSR